MCMYINCSCVEYLNRTESCFDVRLVDMKGVFWGAGARAGDNKAIVLSSYSWQLSTSKIHYFIYI